MSGRQAKRLRRARQAKVWVESGPRELDTDDLRGSAVVVAGLGPSGQSMLSVDVSALSCVERRRLYRAWRRSTGDYAVVVAHERIVGNEPGCAVARHFFRDGTEAWTTVDDGPVAGTWKSEWRIVRAGPDVARVAGALVAEHSRRGGLPMDATWAKGGSA